MLDHSRQELVVCHVAYEVTVGFNDILKELKVSPFLLLPFEYHSQGIRGKSG